LIDSLIKVCSEKIVLRALKSRLSGRKFLVILSEFLIDLIAA
jgi:hypothetical protein